MRKKTSMQSTARKRKYWSVQFYYSIKTSREGINLKKLSNISIKRNN